MSAAITELESDLQNIETQRNLGDSEFLESAHSTTKEKIERYKSELKNLSTDCIIDNEPELPVTITKPVDALLETTELDHAYEELIETNLKMRTGANPDILAENKRALTEFLENYENASENQKVKWLEAKELAREQLATLEAKAARATKTVEDWESAIQDNGLKGYFLYAEGYVNGEFIRRMDWKMNTTSALDGNISSQENIGRGAVQQPNVEIKIKIYELTADEDGNLVYTPTEETGRWTAHMKELGAMLTEAEIADAENFNQPAGGGIPFSGNFAGANKKSSVMIRQKKQKKEAEEVEIPDWTDGKVVTMIEEYKQKCANGMTHTEAKRLKKEMQKEIINHQGKLIKELDEIHQKQGSLEDTAILLNLWKQKKGVWENEVNSLGTNCMPSITKPVPCDDFSNTLDKYQEKCAQLKLAPDEAQSLLDSMQDCINKSKKKLEEFDKEIQKLRNIRDREKAEAKKNGNTYVPDPDLALEIQTQEVEYEKMKNEIEEDENKMNSLPPYKEEDCITFKESTKAYNIPFKKGKFEFKDNPDDVVDLQEIVTILRRNPKNKAILQPRTADPKSALFGLINGVALVQGRKKTLEDYFKKIGLFDQVEIVVDDNSYNKNWDVLGTLQVYEYDLD